MKKFYVVLSILFSATIASAQLAETTLNSQSEAPKYRKAVYLELLGPSIVRGLSFDMRVNKGREDGLGFRAGIGGANLSGSDQSGEASISLMTFPLEVNHLVGSRKHFFEAGGGLLPAYAHVEAQGDFTGNEYVAAEGFGLAGGFLTAGYRFQPINNGFFFQAKYTPLLLRGGGFQNYIGLGFGVSFK